MHQWGQASLGPAPQPRLLSPCPLAGLALVSAQRRAGRAAASGCSLEAAGRGRCSSQGVNSSPPARRKPSGCWVLSQGAAAGRRGSFVPVLALSRWQTCCLLPAPDLSKPLALTQGSPPMSRVWLFCASAPETGPGSYQGEGERRWLVEQKGKEQDHFHIDVRGEKRINKKSQTFTLIPGFYQLS